MCELIIIHIDQALKTLIEQVLICLEAQSSCYQLHESPKCLPNRRSFCGVAESNDNEDISLAQCDKVSSSKRNCHFLYEKHQHLSNLPYNQSARCAAILISFNCHLNIEKLIEKNLQHQQDAVDENQQGPAVDENQQGPTVDENQQGPTVKEAFYHHLEQYMGETIQQRESRKQYYNIKHSMKRYKMNKYRMYLVFFLCHLKPNDSTKNTVIEEHDDSKTTKETTCGGILWVGSDTQKNTEKELHSPVNKSMKNYRKVADRVHHTSHEDNVLHCVKDKVRINDRCVNICDEESGRDSCRDIAIRKCTLSSQIKFNDSILNSVKTLENGDLRTSPYKNGDIPSYLDDLSDLGLNLKLPSVRSMFWQEIMVYPFTRHDPEVNNPQGDPHQFMHYEVFRLCSFSYTRFPSNFDVWVTQLAQAGFYCLDHNGKIICFDCGKEFLGAVNSPIENAHHPGCRHHERSRPLHMWTQGLSQEVLAIYYNRYGSLRPYTFETSEPVGMSLEHPDGAHDTSNTSHSEHQNNELAASGTSLGRGSDIPSSSLAMTDRGESSARDDIRPPYHSETLSSATNERNFNYLSSNEPHSLPRNLNDVSGALVSEESVELPGFPSEFQVLTSAARNPVRFYSTPSHNHHPQQAEGGTENGAVGGADPTLDLSKASYPLFSNAAARRQSFSAWRPDHTHRPDDLVAAGFFYAGYADCVRCFYCGLGLKYWRATDIPAYQHARYRPHCVYNRLYKGQEYVDRVQEDVQLEQGQGAANQVTNQNSMPRPSVQDEVEAAVVTTPTTVQTEVTPAAVLVQDTAQRVTDLMDSAVAQEALRNGWQRNQVQQALDQIIRELGEGCLEISILLDVLTNLNMNNPEANLPSGDSTESSDSGVNDNTEAPSSLASVRASPSENLNVSSGRRGVDVADAVHEREGAQRQDRTTPIQQPAPPRLEFSDLFRTVEREHTLLAERTTCRLCHLRQVSCIFLPCGHVIACQDCADNATHCVLCAKQIIGTANIYLA